MISWSSSSSSSNPTTTWGWGLTIAAAYYKGLGQGVLNTLNGVQDVMIGVANLPAAGVNTIAWAEEKLKILDSADSMRIPCIPSPDWSRDMVVSESDSCHEWSKVIGGNSAVILLTVGAGSAIKALAQSVALRFPPKA